MTVFEWAALDLIVALLGVNLLATGDAVVRRSVNAILDEALPAQDVASIESVLDRYRRDGIQFHAVRTRESGRQRFVDRHVLVPDDWTVKRAHDVTERPQTGVCTTLPSLMALTRLEPLHHPASYGHERHHAVVSHLGRSER